MIGRTLHIALVGGACLLAACSHQNPAYNAGPTGQWSGPGAYGAPVGPGGQAAPPGQWTPPPAPTQPAIPAFGPTLVGAAVGAMGVMGAMLGQIPPAASVPAPWPQPTPDGATSSAVFEDEVLARTNQQRARGAVCGGTALPAAPPVVTSSSLRAAARGHSRDMALRDYFSHGSPEGAGPAERAAAAGFTGGLVGENIAVGQTTPAEVVQAWLDSPGHCQNLMDPRFRYLGVGYFLDGAGDRYGHYWTQNFGG